MGEVLGHDDLSALVKSLVDRQWTSTAIAKILEEEGWPVSEKHLRAHRRGDHSDRECAAPTIGVIQ